MSPQLLSRSKELLQKEGLRTLAVRIIHFIYFGYIRDKLPRKTARYNGQVVRAPRLLDNLVPQVPYHKPNYESGIVAGLEKTVEPGDEIVIIGGGWGVTAAVAAKLTGPSGSVTVYEGAQQNVSHVRETAELNGVEDIITVNHAIVGPAIDLRGEAGEPERLEAKALSDCDVLELDCEGAERQILTELAIQPRAVVVESHGMYESPTDIVATLLSEKGYNVVSTVVADERLRDYHENKDIFVLTALSKDT